MEHVNCPICDIDDTRFFAEEQRRSIVRCRSCGLLYVNPRPKQNEHRDYFEGEYITSEERVDDDFGLWRTPALTLESDAIKKLKPQGGKILDIGCAGGLFLSFFESENSWELHGVELSKFAAEQAKKKFGIDVFCGTLNEAHYPDSHFDVVTILDTFPLIPDPVKELCEINRILKPDGILAIEIPGYRFRLTKNKGLLCYLLYRKWVSLNPSVHLFYYSDKTLRKLLHKYGFEISHMDIEPPPSYGGKVQKLIPKVFHFISSLLFKISLQKINLGAKVLYIAQKKSDENRNGKK